MNCFLSVSMFLTIFSMNLENLDPRKKIYEAWELSILKEYILIFGSMSCKRLFHFYLLLTKESHKISPFLCPQDLPHWRCFRGLLSGKKEKEEVGRWVKNPEPMGFFKKQL